MNIACKYCNSNKIDYNVEHEFIGNYFYRLFKCQSCKKSFSDRFMTVSEINKLKMIYNLKEYKDIYGLEYILNIIESI